MTQTWKIQILEVPCPRAQDNGAEPKILVEDTVVARDHNAGMVIAAIKNHEALKHLKDTPNRVEVQHRPF